MRKFSADFIFPVSQKPVKNGIVLVEDNGIIKDVIDPAKIDHSVDDVEFHKGILCPGFVNSHCHLELSFLKNKIDKHIGLDVFIRELELKRNENEEIIIEAIKEAEKEMIENGIVAVGDISNNDYSFKLKSKKNIYYHTFIEVFSFDPEKADRAFERGIFLTEKLKTFDREPKSSITPHAPYSCSEKLFLTLMENAKLNSHFLTIHNQENEEENELFLNKTGKLLNRLKQFGINLEPWVAPEKNSLQYIIDLADPEVRLLLVHNTVTKEEDINYALNKNKNLWWCLCPGANLYIETKLPDLNLFYKHVNERITIGTDSLASNDQLSVLEEIKIIKKNFPQIPLEELIKWSTLNGAEFLQIENKYGSIEVRKSPGLNLISGVNIQNNALGDSASVRRLI